LKILFFHDISGILEFHLQSKFNVQFDENAKTTLNRRIRAVFWTVAKKLGSGFDVRILLDFFVFELQKLQKREALVLKNVF